MGVHVGTITLKDGKVLPLEDYIEAVTEHEQHDEVIDVVVEDERRFKRCIRRAVTGAVWEGQSRRHHGRVITYNEYKLATENLKRKGEADMNMDNDKIYATKAYALFEAFFKNPKQWMNSRRLSELTGVGVSSITTLLRRPVAYLIAEGMMEQKEDVSGRGSVWMFVAQCEDPKQEARLWYRRMLEATHGQSRKPLTSSRTARPVLQEAKAVQSVKALPGGNGVVSVQVDTNTMEALVRVPLASLPKVIEALR